MSEDDPVLPNDLDWQVEGMPGQVCPEVLLSGAWYSLAVPIKENRKRVVYRVPATEPSGVSLIVKRFRGVNLLDRVKSLFRCKAREEFEAGRCLRAAGVPAPRMSAWARRGQESYLAMEEIPNGMSFSAAWAEAGTDSRSRECFLEELAKFLSVLVRAGVDHPDMHMGNILCVRSAAGEMHFHLVDVYGVRLADRIGPRHLHRLLAWLDDILFSLGMDRANSFLRTVVGNSPHARGSLSLGGIHSFRSAAVRARWPGRRRRMLTESSLVTKHANADGLWLVRNGMAYPDAQAAVEGHRNRDLGKAEPLKDDVRRCVSRITSGSHSLIVKEYRRAGYRFLLRPDRACWLNTYRMEMYGIPVGVCLAWLRCSDSTGYVVQEDAGTDCLYNVLRRSVTSLERRPYLLQLAGILARMHSSGVAHRDMKTGNFMLDTDREGGAPVLRVIDADTASFGRRVSWRRRAKALTQILDSWVRSATRFERLRLVAVYSACSGLDRGVARSLLRRLPSSLV